MCVYVQCFFLPIPACSRDGCFARSSVLCTLGDREEITTYNTGRRHAGGSRWLFFKSRHLSIRRKNGTSPGCFTIFLIDRKEEDRSLAVFSSSKMTGGVTCSIVPENDVWACCKGARMKRLVGPNARCLDENYVYLCVIRFVRLRPQLPATTRRVVLRRRWLTKWSIWSVSLSASRQDV